MPKRDDRYMASRRDDILDAAEEILFRDGLIGLSTTAICEEAKLSSGALYTHFATKNEIIIAATRRMIERRKQMVAEHASALDFILAAPKRMDSPQYTRLVRIDLQLVLAAAQDEQVAKVLSEARLAAIIPKALQKAKKLGQVSVDVDVDATALAVEALILGLGLLAQVGKQDAAKFRKAAEIVFNRLLR